ncbi:hypothetical protein AZSI13_31070 [Azospira sp. I13]|nr:hypothetical protein AZSI13_31070 [Azospira sp. I13]
MDGLERHGELVGRLGRNAMGRRACRWLLCWLCCLSQGPVMAASPHYAAAGPYRVQVALEVWHDAVRQRDIPVKRYGPEGLARVPVILFSHGLGGSREAGEAWLRHWAAHGYLGIALQHTGSDGALLQGGPMAIRRALKAAMTPEQSRARIADVQFVLDELARRQGEPGWNQADLAHIGLAGHSFGAVTTQAMAGEQLSVGAPVEEPRLAAFLALSPSARGGENLLNARFSRLQRPFFSITGSRDDGIGLQDIDAANRTLPYRHMPPGDKYLLVLEGGAHMHFAGQHTLRQQAPPRLEQAVQAASLAFWEVTLKGRIEARTWLRQSFPATLIPGDRWEFK